MTLAAALHEPFDGPNVFDKGSEARGSISDPDCGTSSADRTQRCRPSSFGKLYQVSIVAHARCWEQRVFD